MTLLLTLPAFLLFTLPWLNPFAPGPSPAVMPWLVALAAFGGLIWVGVMQRVSAPADDISFTWRWAGPLAWAVFFSGVASSVIGLMQYFGVAAPLEPWARQGTFGEAFANLRQRNQFASLTNMALVAALWLAATHSTSPEDAPEPDNRHRPWLQPMLLLGAALLGAGNAASSSRTGLLQLVLLAGLLWLWGGWRHRAQRYVYLAALGTYALGLLALPYLAGFDMSEQGMFARLRDGAPTCSSRLLLWRNVLELVAQKPWLGWGWGELDYAHYSTLYAGPRFCEILDNAHNLPLHLAVELGLPAALLVCGGVLWWLLRQRPWQEADSARQMGWGMLAVIGLHSLLEYPLWYGPFQIAAIFCVGLLWRPRKAASSSNYESNRPLAQWICAVAAIIIIASSAYATWDYHRISQLYVAPGARDAAYVDDTIGKARGSWLFSHQVQFAELTTTLVDRRNARWVFEQAGALLHYSPEPRVIEKMIESAVMLGKDDEALTHLARFRAAFPKEHAAWARMNARMPEVIDGLNPVK